MSIDGRRIMVLLGGHDFEMETIADLVETFPGGWYGGELPESGFWGRVGLNEGLLSRLADWCGPALSTRSPCSGHSD